MKKIRVGILCGGKSGEHEVSLQSTKNIVEAMDKEKYEVVIIGIDKQGQWSLFDPTQFLLHADDPKRISLGGPADKIALIPSGGNEGLINTSQSKPVEPVDVVFPVLHGPLGEDGTVQGLLKLANLPFVGAGVLGSAIGMDKDVMKRLLRDAQIPVAKSLIFHKYQRNDMDFEQIQSALGTPLFVKPANYGSSIGVNKVFDPETFNQAVEEAFQCDYKILIEEFIKGREIECSVLGNQDPIASLIGEIVPRQEFYSYDAKYIDADGAYLKVPADLESHVVKKMQALSIKSFKALCCEGMARVDGFLKPDNEIIINEINTIPGFTRISMYPKLWEVSGIPYAELIDRLIELALERFERERDLNVSAFF